MTLPVADARSKLCLNSNMPSSFTVSEIHFNQLMKTRRRLELLLEDLPCEHDPMEYYETSDKLLEPLLLCHESLVWESANTFILYFLPSLYIFAWISCETINWMCYARRLNNHSLFLNLYLFIWFGCWPLINTLKQSCGSGILADGRLADLIRRVATFGMILMKLDLRQVSSSSLSSSLLLFIWDMIDHLICFF